MSKDLVYMPAILKHFQRLAEEWRREAKILSSQATVANSFALAQEARVYEQLGKELKQLTSDVRHNRVGIL